MSKTRLIANLPANNAAFTPISATICPRRVEIREDESVTPQGLQYQLPDDNFVTTDMVGTPSTPNGPQIVLGNAESQGRGQGPILGLPAQTPGGNSIAATVLIKIRSNGAGGNAIRVTESD